MRRAARRRRHNRTKLNCVREQGSSPLETPENEKQTAPKSRAVRRWGRPRTENTPCPRAGQLAAEDLRDEDNQVHQQGSAPMKTPGNGD